MHALSCCRSRLQLRSAFAAMKKMRLSHWIFAILAVLGPLAFTGAYGADPEWEFDNHGEINLGYRFKDVQGYEPKYEELFNLRRGLRVYDFSVQGSAREKAHSLADGYSLSASGLGGEPFSTAQLTARKTDRYDLRAM